MKPSGELMEVEVTGPLNTSQAARLASSVSDWKFEGRLNRYLINFSNDELRVNRIDLRARITNGQPEMVVKYGEWGSGKRVESAVQVMPGEFEHLVKAIVGLGFKTAIGAHRLISRYSSGGLELSIIEVPNYSVFFEVEQIVPIGEEDSTATKLVKWAEARGLTVFTKQEYLKFIADLDTNANDVLDFRDLDCWDLVRRQTEQA